MARMPVREHPLRTRLLGLVRSEPGHTAPVLARRLGMQPNACRHHVDALRRLGLVRRRRINSVVRIFPNRPSYRDTWQLDAARRETGLAQILELLDSRRPVRQSRVVELARRRGISPSTARYRLERLVSLGLLKRCDEAWRVTYRHVVPDPGAPTPTWGPG